MKQRVQAQRKFAHSIVLPYIPTNSNGISERRDIAQPNQNVIQHNMSAKNLLDVVAFQSIHSHLQPVVVLERLQDASQNNDTETIVNNNHVHTANIRKSKHLRDKRNILSLRSRNVTRNSKNINIKRIINTVVPTGTCNRIKRATVKTNTDFGVDDDTPLKYLTKSELIYKRRNAPGKTGEHGTQNNTTKQTVKNEYLKPGTSTGFYCSNEIERWIKDSMENNNHHADSQTDLTGSVTGGQFQDGNLVTTVPQIHYEDDINETQISMPTEMHNNMPTEMDNNMPTEIHNNMPTEMQNNIPSGMQNPLTSETEICMVTEMHNDMPTETQKNMPTRTQNQMTTETQSIILTKTPSPTGTHGQKPTEMQSNMPQNQNQVITKMQNNMLTETHNNIATEKQNNNINDEAANDIELLQNNNVLLSLTNDKDIRAEVIIDEDIIMYCNDNFKAPLPIPTEDDNEERLYYPDSPCPSKKFTTVRDVVNASKPELDKRCKECNQCDRVDKVVRLSNLLQTPCDLETNVSHNNDAQNNDSIEVNNIEHDGLSELRQNLQCPIDTGNSLVGHPQEEIMYLDILPPKSGVIVQITSVKSPNDSKQMLTAKLVDKTGINVHSQSVSLIKHENLLDQLFKVLISAKTISNEPDLVLNRGRSESNIEASDQPTSNESVIIQPGCSEINSQTTTNSPNNSFPQKIDSGRVLDAPVYHPTPTEFQDPIAYFEKLIPLAAKFGICKVVAPPGFKPVCVTNEDIRFTVTNQYITRVYNRWGPGAREMSAIKAYSSKQNVPFNRPPLLDGVEVNLPKLYHLVQRNGGLKNVIEKKRWGRVGDQLGLSKERNLNRKLDRIYVKYLLPYDTLSKEERLQTLALVEKSWNKKSQKMFERAMNPLHRQKRLLGESDTSGDDTEDEEHITRALVEAEDCVVSAGRRMNLANFRKVASNVCQMYLRGHGHQTPSKIEAEYWRLVLLGNDHVCVNTASIDTGDEGYGFSKNADDLHARHPWNLKMVSQNSGNILRSLGPVLGVTIPTLHLGMLFSTSCWHSDPHGLPWIEYTHSGSGKIWYGIPKEQNNNFRKAVETLGQSFCQNKPVWLPSDIVMIPPNLLTEQNVSLSRVEQYPGEYIIVFPKTYSCSICIGYTISESVYFAPNAWLNSVHQVFQEVRESCEPTMFSLEQLLIAVAQDTSVSLSVLHKVFTLLQTIVKDELMNRNSLSKLGIKEKAVPTGPQSRNVSDQDECEFCRTTLYLSKVVGITNKKSSLCLHHALHLLTKQNRRGRDVSTIELITYFSPTQLEGIINRVNSLLEQTHL